MRSGGGGAEDEMGSITDSVDMNLSKLQETVAERGAWHAAVHGVTKNWVEKIPWRRIGYPLQYSWASLVAQLVKNPPAMRETWVWSLGWEDPLEKGKATQLQYSGLENSMDCIVHGVAKSRT